MTFVLGVVIVGSIAGSSAVFTSKETCDREPPPLRSPRGRLNKGRSSNAAGVRPRSCFSGWKTRVAWSRHSRPAISLFSIVRPSSPTNTSSKMHSSCGGRGLLMSRASISPKAAEMACAVSYKVALPLTIKVR